MGFYSNGDIHGISCKLYDKENDTFIIIFEKIYDQEMTTEQIQYIKSLYDKLSYDKNEKYSLKCYTTSWDTYSSSNYMKWWIIYKYDIEKWLNGEDISMNIFC
jgi:hypothetical protein